jgi:hypothetical protein
MRNEHRPEKIIQQQRLQMFFQSRLRLEERKENARLRGIILELQFVLEEHGISSEFSAPLPSIENQPLLPFVYDAVSEKASES